MQGHCPIQVTYSQRVQGKISLKKKLATNRTTSEAGIPYQLT